MWVHNLPTTRECQFICLHTNGSNLDWGQQTCNWCFGFYNPFRINRVRSRNLQWLGISRRHREQQASRMASQQNLTPNYCVQKWLQSRLKADHRMAKHTREACRSLLRDSYWRIRLDASERRLRIVNLDRLYSYLLNRFVLHLIETSPTCGLFGKICTHSSLGWQKKPDGIARKSKERRSKSSW